MTSNHKNIRNLSPDFAIPPGTQVVLTEHQSSESDQGKKKAGTVGVVVKCPSSNSEPYLVRFSDQTEQLVEFANLAMRRREIDNMLHVDPDEDFRPFIIYQCKVGSHAFGLANEDSDSDLRGIFLPPAKRNWSMYKVPEQLEFKDDSKDEVYWELEKFLRLALKANPNILETLWSPLVLKTSLIADRIRESRQSFLSSHIYKTYSGYVLSQFRRMKNAFEKSGQYKSKHAMHLIRLLHSGIGALKTGEIMIDVSEYRDQLLAIRRGEYTFEQIRLLALELDREFQTAFELTKLPDQPDFATVDAILIEARHSMVE